ncbi:uncharacterized protein B0H64DRAFT_318754 [Chaetomium fimeti]|uniref:Uncharacterized protein n=1 Tax=Chaetomium fimeti TaxID=1854472 RepID=A0AAE0HHE4_9PEZI|nr:hypothetical protein B0H64DRAFT_318754 [Chaetomium fimeti]
MTRQAYDLPLRNYVASPGVESSSTAATQSTTSVPAPFPGALSSIVLGGDVDKPRNRAQSRSSTRNKSSAGISSTARSNTPTPRGSPSESRLELLQRRDLSPTTHALDKVHRYLYSMAPPRPMEELAKENRSLHQRIAALQRTETDLLDENQKLAHRLSLIQKRHDSQQRGWKEELVTKGNEFEARIKNLEHQLSQKEEELSQIEFGRAAETTLSDTDITSWFATKEDTWRQWAHDFAHPDPNRVRPGLHPLHLRELCEGVKTFVQLTDNGELPEELLATPDDGVRPARALLHGMLTDFIVSETLESPFWVFDVISTDTLELESPIVPRLNSMSPIGFRMDLAMWNFNIAPPRQARSPRPVPVVDRLAGPQDARKPPRLVTSTQPPSAFTGPVLGLSGRNLPSRQAMEGLYQLLSDRTSHAPAQARIKYAGQLKDRFLRGPARFLLQDQEATGIEKLEHSLAQEIDAALRFSCQLWCRQDTPLVRGLHDLSDGVFNSNSNDIHLYQTQPTAHAKRVIQGALGTEPPAYHDGHPVIMVLQPSIGVSTITDAKEPAKDAKSNSRVWAKATVLVATPKVPAQEPPPAGVQPPASPDAVFVTVEPPIPPASPSGSSSVAGESSNLILPSIAFENTPRPLKQSPPLPLPLAG